MKDWIGFLGGNALQRWGWPRLVLIEWAICSVSPICWFLVTCCRHVGCSSHVDPPYSILLPWIHGVVVETRTRLVETSCWARDPGAQHRPIFSMYEEHSRQTTFLSRAFMMGMASSKRWTRPVAIERIQGEEDLIFF